MAGDHTVSIGEAAELVGTTTRTLRYYEELGLVSSTRPTASAQRRYGASDVERLRHIRELQTLLGLDLDEIAAQLAVSDRLDGLRAEYRSGPPMERREAILEDALKILQSLRERVVERQERLAGFLGELDGRIARVETARVPEPRAGSVRGR
ncbi:MAG: MerR family transcriptional regulator [Acidimicrobiales bacterium]|jgi:MerR family transcriptional regulator, repressor of the yfmOP operon